MNTSTSDPKSALIEYPLGVHFVNPEIEELYKGQDSSIDGLSSGFDLRVPKDIVFTFEQPWQLVNFGIIIRPPTGFHTLLIPRSSLYKNHRVIQTNSIGLVDQNYVGPKDVLLMPLLWHPCEPSYESPKIIKKGERIAQIILQPVFLIKRVPYDLSGVESRGGHGSTGKV